MKIRKIIKTKIETIIDHTELKHMDSNDIIECPTRSHISQNFLRTITKPQCPSESPVPAGHLVDEAPSSSWSKIKKGLSQGADQLLAENQQTQQELRAAMPVC